MIDRIGHLGAILTSAHRTGHELPAQAFPEAAERRDG
jgi:hypothetical protein